MVNEQTTSNQTQVVLKAENVNVYYGNFLAVKGVYLDIPKNQVTAFIGPSGCGKSTLSPSFVSKD
jgi:phosphate transport system ATP-binding protein